MQKINSRKCNNTITFSGKITLNFFINLILYFFINFILNFTRNQLQEDYISDQIGIEEYVDPFKKENK